MTHRELSQRVASAAAPAAAGSSRTRPYPGWVLAVIVAVAAGLRGYQLGRLSFWYDEVVTMRLARAGSPGALVDRLFQIDATRAPLHPLLLQAWVHVFGSSEAAARSLSVVCGVATVVLVFEIGRAAFDAAVGLWAAWLAALSPILIVYAREARMYAWLVLVTCLCWRLLLGPRRSFSAAKAAAYAFSMTALAYSHPLGLLMTATLALAGLIGLRARFGSWQRWLAVHLVVAALTAPWIKNYLDHPAEFLSGPPSLRSLLGTPIGFLGGDSRVLLGLAALIAWGIARWVFRDQRPCADPTSTALAPTFLLLWLIVPPSALYLYSLAAQPIFGPARYTIFVAPAYLILVALGASRTPRALRYALALGLTILAASEFGSKVYAPDLKADWRGFSAALGDRPAGSVLVIVASNNPGRNVEVETARYYLPDGCAAIPFEEATAERLERLQAVAVALAVGSRQGIPAIPLPDEIGPYRFRRVTHFPGLTVWWAEDGSSRAVRSGVGLGRLATRLGSGPGGGVAVAGRFQHRQRQGVEVLVERGSGQLQRPLGRGADAEAPLLELRWNGAEPEPLDHPERPLNLGILSDSLAVLGLEIVWPDGGTPRSERNPAPAPIADPERRFDRDAAEVGSHRQPGQDRAGPAPGGDGLERFGDRIRPALTQAGVEEPLELRGNRGQRHVVQRLLARQGVGDHQVLEPEEAQAGIHGHLGGGAARPPG
ncbi:MAG TPA: glycosyltransferase family 39 protein [Isosphaeraceae bacterium]|nr:glycosyltransferase family 39 protein [Isosphaeraceae bacterium]